MSDSGEEYSAPCKAQVALEALKGKKTIAELAAEYGVSPEEVISWRDHAERGMADVIFGRPAPGKGQSIRDVSEGGPAADHRA